MLLIEGQQTAIVRLPGPVQHQIPPRASMGRRGGVHGGFLTEAGSPLQILLAIRGARGNECGFALVRIRVLPCDC